MRILVVNLTRMGDLIQTIGLTAGLRKVWPDAEIHCLVMSSFAGILDLFRSVDRVLTLDDKILVDRIRENPWAGYLEILSKAEALNTFDYDIIVNPVVSIQASLLGYLLNGRKKLGMFFNPQREQNITSDWTAYHLANEHHLGDRSFNLVDIFARVGGVRAEADDYRLVIPPEGAEFAEVLRRQHNLAGKTVVGFHIGASQSNKAWEPEKFRAVVGNLLSDGNVAVLLFGGYKEKALNTFFGQIESPDFINLIGACNLGELTGVIATVDLFVTNDTGPMHIAAATGRKILNLSLGPVSLWETGPYCEGAIVLQADLPCHPCAFSHECPHLQCHNSITVDLVTQTVRALINHTEIPCYPGVRTWVSRFDPFRLHHFVPVEFRPIGVVEMLFEFKRAVWAMSLVPELSASQDWWGLYCDYLLEYYRFDLGDEDRKALVSARNVLDGLIRQTEELAGLTDKICHFKTLDKKSVDRIQGLWLQIKDRKQKLFTDASNTGDWMDLFDFARFRESSLNGEDFLQLARQTVLVYGNLILQLKTLIRYIDAFNR